MKTIKLNDEIYKELHILTKEEYNRIGNDYKGKSILDKNVRTAFLPGYGTTLFFENIHFIIINDKEPLEKYAIWRNHKVIGYCEITKKSAEKANGANNAVFYFGFDKTTKPYMY